MVKTDALLCPRTLQTARLRLEPLGVRHLEHVMQTLEHQEFMRLTGTHVRYTRFEVQRLLSSLPRRGDRADWAILDREDGQYLGEVVLNDLDGYNQSMNFRILLAHPELVGQGYGTEATNAVVEYGFHLVGLHRISLSVYAFNPRARRVYEKCGFSFEGTQRDALCWEGQWVDQFLMSILKTDPRPDVKLEFGPGGSVSARVMSPQAR
ncbi:GNAT family N-acetyltransferase [Deinococcus fonticola]|uniref:GNAT family N-acetyltransferase n=1 Tax=Deinococcus fonticola TaxID=2528713 RepID=UPI0010751744|nr:GNAT family protein [Deinococcus fonticola]